MSGTQAHEDASVRVRLAALKLANGSLARLLRELADAKVDFRDVIGPAEYPGAMKAWSRTDVDDVQRQRIYDADWREYTEWLRRE